MLEQKKFSKNKLNFPPPSLLQVQLGSYQRFFEKDLKDFFKEVSPIEDYSGENYELFFEDFYLEKPKVTADYAKEYSDDFVAPFFIKTKLIIKPLGQEKSADIFFCDFPLMTKRGSFILNGVERIVVPQIIRAPGVFFTAISYFGQNYFGARIIPDHGCWLEFEMSKDYTLWAKIDKKRRIPATMILRFFGMEDNNEILNTFSEDVKGLDIDIIKETIKKDITKTKDEAIIEIYRSQRPGDLATLDNAKEYLENLFFNRHRYDLSEVGRWRMGQRLVEINPNLEKNGQFITQTDIIATIKEIIRLQKTPGSLPDNIDHLGNRRIRPINELLKTVFRRAMMRIARIARDRMSILKMEEIEPKNIINPRPLVSAINEFFTQGQLSQFMDNENPLAEIEHKRRLSVMGPGGLARKRAGFEVRDVQSSHYGRICPIQTPEGQNVGLVIHMSIFSKINNFGFLETPYFKVKSRRITNEICYLNAIEEERYIIAPATVNINDKNFIVDDLVEARIKGEPGIIESEEIDFIDVSCQQILSIAASLIPFLEHDDANRALMGSNMQRQSVPCLRPEIPLVATGYEKKVAEDSKQLLQLEDDGKVIEVDSAHITIETKNKSKIKYPLYNFIRSNQYTCIHQRPKVKIGDKIKKGDLLADGGSISDGELALGKNLFIAFMSFEGCNYEDAIVISERLLKEDVFTSVHIENFTCDVRDTKLGPEITTADIPNVSEAKLKDLDEDGIIRVGAEVGSDDILVGKISPKGEEEFSPEEILLRKIFGEKAKEIKDTSLRLPHGKRGKVISVKIFSREEGAKLEPGIIKRIQIEIAHTRRISVGDKLAGRHGNKGIIAKILPEEEMPFMEDGTVIDAILNPLSITSRMNVGQVFEAMLGLAAKKLNYQALTPPFDGASEEDIRNELKKAGLPENGKVVLFDGRSGEPFKEKIAVGYMYMLKLIHMVEDKIHMRSIGPYSLITQQPLGGKAQFGGQRFGEMEVWALEGYGAAYTLQEMLTIKSDDVPGRAAAYEAIVKGKDIESPNVPSSFNILVSELKSLGLNLELKGINKKIKD